MPRGGMATVRRVVVPFRRPVATAAGTWRARDSWIVIVRSDDGRCGVGEAPIEDDLAGGHAPADVPADAALAPAMDAALAPAMDAARLDLEGAPAQAWVGVNATIGALEPGEAVAAAEAALVAGFRTLKLKAAPAEDARALVSRVAGIRAALGPDARLRLDANGRWDLEAAVERLAALAELRLEYVEQPLPPGALAEAADLRRRVPVPIAADEGVASEADAAAILAAGAADVLVVKPARVGGPSAVSRIAALAAGHGVPVVVSSLFETGVGLAAGLAAAARLPDVPGWPAAQRDHGLATSDLLEDDLLVESLVLEGGRLRAPGGPGTGGLGVELDRAAVHRYGLPA